MSTSHPITLVEAETLAYIRSFIQKNGYTPTIAEMAAAAGVNFNAVGERVTRLPLKGAITKTPRIARSIRPT
jgi:SOS-response transcriptional repressor LexA